MNHWSLERYHHKQAPAGWVVVTSEGIYVGGPFRSEQSAADVAARLNLPRWSNGEHRVSTAQPQRGGTSVMEDMPEPGDEQ